ncbi:hypothetical protein AGMMS49940_00090 [Spirochaetia bacterium]|nr:hypothetical protein AGMMS49940_00090 [Spirochaetia bacterium]
MFTRSVFKTLFPFIQAEGGLYHAIGFQGSFINALNDKGETVGAQVGAKNVQFLPVSGGITC